VQGFSALLALLDSELLLFSSEKVLWHIFDLVIAIAHLLAQPIRSKFMLLMLERLSSSIKQIDEKAMKEFDTHNINLLIQNLQASAYDEQESLFPRIIKIKFAFAVKLLKLPFLEKKLNGISFLNNVLEQCKALGGNPQNPQNDQSQELNLLVEWIIKEEGIELLIGDSVHIEVIKRSSDIIKFLSQYHYLSPELMRQIFSISQKKKDEASLKIIYELIQETTPYFTEELLETVCKLIKQIPQAQYSEITL